MRYITIGTFDILHIGHIDLIKIVRNLAIGENDTAAVYVNADEFVLERKGALPVQNINLRINTIKNLEWVDDVQVYYGPGTIHYEDCTLVIGNDWFGLHYLTELGLTKEDMDDRNISVLFVPRLRGVSSSALKKGILK